METTALNLFILMLVLINPFSQVMYLSDLIKDTQRREFTSIVWWATVLSVGVYAVFVLFGDKLLSDVFQIRIASLQIFGGLIMLMIAYRSLTVGAEGNRLFKGNPADLAQQVALPYFVGPGMIWLCILAGREHVWWLSLLIVGGVMVINLIILLIVHALYDKLESQRETMLGKYIAILMRTLALIIGGIGVEMILGGLQGAFDKL